MTVVVRATKIHEDRKTHRFGVDSSVAWRRFGSHEEVGERWKPDLAVSAKSEFLRQIGETDHRRQEHIIRLGPEYIDINLHQA